MVTFNFHVQIFETQTIQDSKPLLGRAMKPIEVPIEGLMVKFSGNGSLEQINLTFPGYYKLVWPWVRTELFRQRVAEFLTEY